LIHTFNTLMMRVQVLPVNLYEVILEMATNSLIK